MKRAFGCALLGLLSACPSANQNPETWWLALDGSELRVRLVPKEPEPY